MFLAAPQRRAQLRKKPLRELSAPGNDETSGLSTGSFKAILHVLPVNDIPKRLDVIALDVLVLQIESVLPHIQHEERHGACSQVALMVVELFDCQLFAQGLPGQNRTDGTLNAQRRGHEMGPDSTRKST